MIYVDYTHVSALFFFDVIVQGLILAKKRPG